MNRGSICGQGRREEGDRSSWRRRDRVTLSDPVTSHSLSEGLLACFVDIEIWIRY